MNRNTQIIHCVKSLEGLMGLFFSYKGEKCEAFIDHYEIVDAQNGVQVSLRG